MEQSLGGEDGFMLLSPSPHNEKILSDWAQRGTG